MVDGSCIGVFVNVEYERVSEVLLMLFFCIVDVGDSMRMPSIGMSSELGLPVDSTDCVDFKSALADARDMSTSCDCFVDVVKSVIVCWTASNLVALLGGSMDFPVVTVRRAVAEVWSVGLDFV